MSVTEKREGEWWVTGILGVEDCGPYSTRADAESDRRGMERFLKYAEQRDFFTTDTTVGGKKP